MTYTCAMCKGVFESVTPDEEVLAELREHWGDVPVSECDTVCDDCWRLMALPTARVVLTGALSRSDA